MDSQAEKAVEQRLNLIAVEANEIEKLLLRAESHYHKNQHRTGDCRLNEARARVQAIRTHASLVERHQDPADAG